MLCKNMGFLLFWSLESECRKGSASSQLCADPNMPGSVVLVFLRTAQGIFSSGIKS